MNHLRYLLLFIAAWLWNAQYSLAQSPDSIVLTASYGQISIENLNLMGDLESWYDAVVGNENLAVLEGSFYEMPSQSLDQHQVYKKLAWVSGEVYYDGQRYRNIEMMYNSFSDLLIIRNIGMVNLVDQAILPDQQKVMFFKTHGDKFVRFPEARDPNMRKGFYQLLFDGHGINVVVKRSKREMMGTTHVEYLEESRALVGYQGEYVPFKGSRTLYKMFPEHKIEIKKIIKTEVGYLDKHDYAGLSKVTALCDKLIEK